jgi:hypothetical protein
VDRTDGAIALLAASQHGAFGLHQLIELGGSGSLARRRCERRVWRLAARGVFVIAGAPATFEQRVMVAVLSAGPGALASHRTAARLWEVSGRMSVPVEITIPYGRKSNGTNGTVHRSRDLDLADPTARNGIPVTGLGRTVLDVAAVEPQRARPVMWQAMRTHGLTWHDLLRVLIGHSRHGRPGLGEIRRLINEHYGVIAGDSGTEDRAYQILVDSGRVPVPDRLVPVMCADGVEVTADFAWPELRAVLEIYGVDHMVNEQVQQADAHRANQIVLAGWSMLTYTGKMLRRPDQFIHDVEGMLRGQGWQPPRQL